ncbi:MAG: CHAD domain-containing protein [Gemmatimonadales bacterium]|jgi:CHAD domain-containing protein/CYTH domain-containing protein
MASVSHELLHRPVEETARVLALAWLEEADAALERLSDPDDDEALHDFRVSLRRFRSCVRAYQPYLKGSSPKKSRKLMGQLASATNVGRDTEVQILWLNAQTDNLKPRERKGLRWLLNALEERRDLAYGDARARIAREYREARRSVTKNFSSYTLNLTGDGLASHKPFVEVTADLIEAHADEVRSLLASVHTPEDEEPAHNARIAAKRLRYLAEPLRDSFDAAKKVVKDIKRLQDVLGELNDTHVLTGEVAGATEVAAAEQARRMHELALEESSGQVPRRRSVADVTRGLLAITRLLAERRARLFTDLERGWLGTAPASFFGRVADLVTELRRFDNDDHEIERKFLLSELPETVREAPSVLIEQGWIPGETIQERLRRVRSADGVRYYRTIKSGHGIRRFELEEKVSRRTFHSLWPLTERARIRKRRYRVPDGELVFEIDDFTAPKLVLAEVELPHEDHEFDLPDWLQAVVVSEVTGDTDYENINLARRASRQKSRRR